MNKRISHISDFLLQLDGLKSVNRRTYINGGQRLENSAEHSWHLAMACWTFGKSKKQAIDRLLPFLHNISSEGRAWQDNIIHKDQVLKMHSFIENENPEIYAWFIENVEIAVEKGWLNAD